MDEKTQDSSLVVNKAFSLTLLQFGELSYLQDKMGDGINRMNASEVVRIAIDRMYAQVMAEQEAQS